MPGVEVQTVAHALDIHPFMLSRWRKDARDGVLRGRARRVNVPTRSRKSTNLRAHLAVDVLVPSRRDGPMGRGDPFAPGT